MSAWLRHGTLVDLLQTHHLAVSTSGTPQLVRTIATDVAWDKSVSREALASCALICTRDASSNRSPTGAPRVWTSASASMSCSSKWPHRSCPHLTKSRQTWRRITCAMTLEGRCVTRAFADWRTASTLSGQRTDGGRCPIDNVHHARERSVTCQCLRRPISNLVHRNENSATLPRSRQPHVIWSKMAGAEKATITANYKILKEGKSIAEESSIRCLRTRSCWSLNGFNSIPYTLLIKYHLRFAEKIIPPDMCRDMYLSRWKDFGNDVRIWKGCILIWNVWKVGRTENFKEINSYIEYSKIYWEEIMNSENRLWHLIHNFKNF